MIAESEVVHLRCEDMHVLESRAGRSNRVITDTNGHMTSNVKV